MLHNLTVLTGQSDSRQDKHDMIQFVDRYIYMVQNAITGEICLRSVQIHIYVCDHSYTHRLPINEIQYNSVRDWVRKFGGYWNFIFGIHNFVQFTVKNRLFLQYKIAAKITNFTVQNSSENRRFLTVNCTKLWIPKMKFQ